MICKVCNIEKDTTYFAIKDKKTQRIDTTCKKCRYKKTNYKKQDKFCKICNVSLSNYGTGNHKYCHSCKEKKCLHCEKDIVSRTAKFCSKSCADNYKIGISYKKDVIKTISVNCLNCNINFDKKENSTKEFCNKNCAYQYSKGKERPQRKKGLVVNCDNCKKPIYRNNVRLLNNKRFNSCSIECSGVLLRKDKINLICEVCKKDFFVYPSRIKQAKERNQKIRYCSSECRCKDKDVLKENSLKGQLAQLNKYGLNKLELAGSNILKEMNISFEEQKIMFNKFCVDICLTEYKIIIQWDGEYWHSKEKRIKLDQSQDAYFTKCGYKVLRFTEKQVFKQKQLVNETIRRAIQDVAKSS
jgi:very-short-patch-repair endonuclease